MKLVAMSLVAACLATGPALASETLTATFTQPDGGVTTQGFDGIVQITVSGVGQSDGTTFNDAFYLFDPPTHDASYYQLTFGTTTLVGYDPSQDAANYILGSLPAYNPDHTYTFYLNTGVTTLTDLHFGVSDGQFSDNTGAYRITVSQVVPEPASWALMVLGVGCMGASLRSRRRPVVAAG
jgi:hypothetical protein